jgi:hypothetical protein
VATDVLRRRPHDHAEVLGGEPQEPLDLLLEDAGRLVRSLDVVGAPASRIGHRLQEALVVPLPEADRRGGDASLCRLSADRRELRGIGHSLVGVAVGEEDHAVDPVLLEVLGDELTPAQPATGEVGHALGLDGPDLGGEVGLLLAGRGLGHGRDIAAEGHHARRVLGAETPQEVPRRILGGLERLAGHGAGAVQDEREVEGDASLRRRRVARHAQQCAHGDAGGIGLVLQEQ